MSVEVRAEDGAAENSADAYRLRGEYAITGWITVPAQSEREETGLGFGGTFGAGFGSFPLALGVGFMSGFRGTSSDRVFPSLLDIEREESTLQLDVWARVQPWTWLVRPYLEGSIGTRRLRSSYAVSFVGSPRAAALDDTDWLLCLGFGAGVELYGFSFGYRRLATDESRFSRSLRLDGRTARVRHVTAVDSNLFMIGWGGKVEL